MKARESLIERFDTANQSTDLTSGILDQHIVHEALRLGVADRLAPRLRDLYRHKRDVMSNALSRTLSAHVSWEAPRGGFFLWARLAAPLRSETLMPLAHADHLIAKYAHVCAHTTDAGWKCWGRGGAGELADGKLRSRGLATPLGLTCP